MNFDGKTTVAKINGDTYDIIEALIDITPQAINQVKPNINKLINLTGNAYKDALLIAAYIRKNIVYKQDGYNNQNIQLPGRLINTKKGDCKSFSLLFCSMMKAAGHEAGYRFASYRPNKIPTHVYNWILYKNNLLTFDTCVKTLKESPRHTYIKDMNINYLSAPELTIPEFADALIKKGLTKAQIGPMIQAEVDRRNALYQATKNTGFLDRIKETGKKVTLAPARIAFLALVRLNFRSLATRFVLLGQKDSKEFWEEYGGEYDALQRAIDAGKNKRPVGGEGTRKIGNIIYGPEGGGGGGGESGGGKGIMDYVKYLGPAAIVIEAIVKLFKKKEVKDPNKDNLEQTKQDFDLPEPSEKEKLAMQTAETSFKPSPLLIGGVIAAGILVYLLIKKKRK